MSHQTIEYGVIVDRTTHGLGYYLAVTRPTRETAERARTVFGERWHECPVVVKVRTVTRSEWEDLPPVEHVGGCNERCHGDSHYLLGETP